MKKGFGPSATYTPLIETQRLTIALGQQKFTVFKLSLQQFQVQNSFLKLL